MPVMSAFPFTEAESPWFDAHEWAIQHQQGALRLSTDYFLDKSSQSVAHAKPEVEEVSGFI